ncbi:AAA family ATPase [Roseobacter sp. HKCCD9010]|uniref:AAA family ATPase n=1 Tax=unclassified Roseobacter TaxID=196798 RepID=UPI001492AC0B|nr:AAA family ATPase [Rhodobacterales bacterium HKCCD4356]NNV13321.1 AAA family ATPase [Roseobacter sp. HKCCD7357]NNV17572.1 AAA family ATPase [Roseobacter sp. HKCCD8768]NNV27178.1 AAA family ATPase [Roseobacter sp. HKCCD8192]NNV31298.1 AAA family ATPase [Roseobacter sp. HKCCD9061]NNV35549.1 AAA family ATPase [Roseobacter sp. HKCCD9073]NNV39958.1 AAA family ATPase [Roseobacter sp. HKCCD9054]NNV44142.1 AAA family ATPase [Roseobacter sp. HKCCD6497]NNV48344.1 AAA family ATPase [Roseobacter sp.
MQIKRLRVQNYRSARDLTIDFSDLTVVLGANNSGKSTALRALEIFFEAAPKVSDEDFYQREGNDILVTITFSRLVEDEIEQFGSAVIDGQMTIQRVFSTDKDINYQYAALAPVFPGFSEIRNEKSKTKQRSIYSILRQEMTELPAAQNADQVLENLEQWESQHPDRLELQFLRNFFGAPNVANGKLRKKTALSFVPAVADAQEVAGNEKTSPIVKLLTDVSRQIYENREELRGFIDAAQGEFEALTNPENFPQLSGISERLTDSLQRYYANSSLLAEWSGQDGLRVEYPKPTIRIENDGFNTLLANVGHGLQRAALFAVVQYLAETQTTTEGADFAEPQSDIILLVEEPEIYQHPHKQHVISDAFSEIVQVFSQATGIRFQIIFATHSEKFVKMHSFERLRLVRQVDGERWSHSVSSVSLTKCSKYFASLVGRDPMPDEAFAAKLHIFSREVCEGFFADRVVLVEGVTDKAVLEGLFKIKGRSAYGEGVSIISVEGKNKIDKPFYIFSEMGIPTYAIFDSDITKKPRHQRKDFNMLFQKMIGVTQPQEFPAGVFPRFAAFESDLEGYLRDRIGKTYDEIRAGIAEEFGLQVGELSKTPHAMGLLLQKAIDSGTTFPLLDQIVEAIDSL